MKFKWYHLLTAIVFGLGALGGGLWLINDVTNRTDSGILACRAMAKNSTVSSNNDAMTREDYLKTREVFANSKHQDIKKAGTEFVDAAWQLQGNNDIVGMLFIQQVTTSYQNLAGACANHDVVLPSLSSFSE